MEDYNRDMAVNTTTALVAARAAVTGFKRLPAHAAKTFIYTGNKLNVMSDPKCSCLGWARPPLRT